MPRPSLVHSSSLVPRPSRVPAEESLALLSQHVRKTGKPIRTQDSKQSCDFNAYWNTAQSNCQVYSFLNYVINVIVLIQQCQADPILGEDIPWKMCRPLQIVVSRSCTCKQMPLFHYTANEHAIPSKSDNLMWAVAQKLDYNL